jgi:hypothetical protein
LPELWYYCDVAGLRRWWPVPLALVIVWAIFGYFLTKPTDFHDYHKAVVQAAESASDAVSTAQLTVQAQLDDRVTGPYVHSTLQRSVDAVAGAWKQFAGITPVDEATTKMRDELGPLLLSAVNVLGDLDRAENSGGAATARALPALDPVAQRLSDFVEAHR